MSSAPSQMQLTAAQVQAIYNNRFTFARRITRKITGSAFKSGIPFAAGQQSDPYRVTTGNYLAGIKLHVQGTMAYNLAANTAAPTLTDVGHLGLINNVSIIGEDEVTPVSLSGFAQENFRILDEKADYVETAIFNLPPANTTSAAVQTNEDVDFWLLYPNVQDFIDLLGIQNVNNDKLNINVQINFGVETNCVNLPAGSTATFTGTVDLYAIRFRANASNQPGPDFTKFFNALSVTRNASLNSSKYDININYKNTLTRLLLHVYTGANTLDANNSLGLKTITLTASSGQIVLRKYDADDLQQDNFERYGPTWYGKFANKGVYVIDLDMIREYLPCYNYTDLKVELEFANTPATGATVSMYLQGLTNTFPQVPLFM